MRRIFLLLLLLLPSSLTAQVAFDAASTPASCINCSSLTYSHTSGSGSDRAIVVGLSISNSCGTSLQDVTGVTYAGTALASVTNAAPVNVCSPNPDGRISQWQLVNNATGANNVIVTLGGASGNGLALLSGATTWTGVHQTTPVRSSATANGNSAAASVTPASTNADDFLADFVCDGTTVTSVGANQTSNGITDVNAGASCNNAGHSRQDGVDGAAMTWTVGNDIWLISALSLQPSGGGPPPCSTFIALLGAGCK